MSAISGYYTNSPETVVESDLADLRTVKTGDEFSNTKTKHIELHHFVIISLFSITLISVFC